MNLEDKEKILGTSDLNLEDKEKNLGTVEKIQGDSKRK